MRLRQGVQISTIAGTMVLALLLHPLASAQDTVPTQATNNQSQPESPKPQQSDEAGATAVPSTTQSSGEHLPDSPSMVQSETNKPQATAQSQQTEPVPHQPLGAAVAEPLQTTGIAVARPAGAAVAPAKQRRVRSMLIKVGALVGAGVAIGTTVALSQGSPSRPPGSH